jgi:hypothetical protein
MLGSVALAVSILNYLRDKPKLKVSLKWDMTDTQTGKQMGLVRVTNVGRRPAHLGAVALALPSKYEHSTSCLANLFGASGSKRGASLRPFS